MSKNVIALDETDLAILRILQRDVNHSLDSLAHDLNISTNTCWRRIKRLREDGIIKRRVALLDAAKLGLHLTVFVSIRTNSHSADWMKRFGKVVETIPEVVEFYRMAGDTDYLLKLTLQSVAGYDDVYKRLVSKIEIDDISATFAMECIKNTTELPI